jgi:hypothetical protein
LREIRELSVDMVEQNAKLYAPKSCQFLHQRRLTCHAVLTGEDARSQAKAFRTFFVVFQMTFSRVNNDVPQIVKSQCEVKLRACQKKLP